MDKKRRHDDIVRYRTYKVEVGGGAKEVALDVVAALVVSEALVQGLVQVADEVREELEGLPRSKRRV